MERYRKHILIFEAFSAKTISKTLRFLEKEVGKAAKNNFISALGKFRQNYDFPIDKIDDKYLDYFGKIDALKVGEEERLNTNNEYDIYAIKFWFSTDIGYMGFSGVGKSTFSVSAPPTKTTNDYPPKDKLMELGISKGLIKSIKTNSDYRNLKTGDKVVGMFSSSPREWYRFGKATIFNDGEQIFAIQSIASGSASDRVNRREWDKYGSQSWSLGTNTSESDDHYFLCRWIEDDQPLRYEGEEIPKEEEKIEIDPMSYNLPFYGKTMHRWGDGNSITKDKIEKSDFAIILYFDRMMSTSYEKTTTTKSKRKDQKEGAYALRSHEDIKNENINRYISVIAKSMGISSDRVDFKNLHKIPSKILIGKFALIQIRNENASSNLAEYERKLFDIIDSYDSIKDSDGKVHERNKESVQYYIDRLDKYIKSIYSENTQNNVEKNYNAIINYINKSDADDTSKKLFLEILDKTIQIGIKISDHFSKQPINTIVDLQIFSSKIGSLRDLVRNKRNFSIDSTLSNLYSTFYYSPEDTYDRDAYTSRILFDRSNEWKKQQINTLNNLLKYLDSVL